MANAEATISISPKAPAAKRVQKAAQRLKPATGGEAPGSRAAKPSAQGTARAPQRRVAEFETYGTAVPKVLVVSDRRVVEWAKKNFEVVDSFLNYVSVYAPDNIRRNVAARAAAEGLEDLMTDKVKAAEVLLRQVTVLADDAGTVQGVRAGEHRLELKLTSRLSSKLCTILTTVDAAFVAADALWIQDQIERKERDKLHADGQELFQFVYTMARQLRAKLVQYRKDERERFDDSLNTEAEFAELFKALTGIDVPLSPAPSAEERARAATTPAASAEDTTQAPAEAASDTAVGSIKVVEALSA